VAGPSRAANGRSLCHSVWKSRIDHNPESALYADLVPATRRDGIEYCPRAPEKPAKITCNGHTVVIALKQRTVVLKVTRAAVQNGEPISKNVRVRELNEPIPEIHAPDALYFDIEDNLLAESFEASRNDARSSGMELLVPSSPGDPVIEQLAQALLTAGELGGACGRLFAGAVGVAILMRVLRLRFDIGLPSTRPKTAALPKWRLKRAIDYVDAHLDETITLSNLAAATGLTRMHFAAQFRAAMGVRPHEYLLRRRIERAQDLLSKSSLRLVDVALSVGFQTQAHFTTVFKRFVGTTPHQWRSENYQAPDMSEPGRIDPMGRREREAAIMR
jgi:AraC-like DNA-binding protein